MNAQTSLLAAFVAVLASTVIMFALALGQASCG
jgi:hypothetical protein